MTKYSIDIAAFDVITLLKFSRFLVFSLEAKKCVSWESKLWEFPGIEHSFTSRKKVVFVNYLCKKMYLLNVDHNSFNAIIVQILWPSAINSKQPNNVRPRIFKILSFRELVHWLIFDKTGCTSCVYLKKCVPWPCRNQGSMFHWDQFVFMEVKSKKYHVIPNNNSCLAEHTPDTRLLCMNLFKSTVLIKIDEHLRYDSVGIKKIAIAKICRLHKFWIGSCWGMWCT